jgi:hypothetical protein
MRRVRKAVSRVQVESEAILRVVRMVGEELAAAAEMVVVVVVRARVRGQGSGRGYACCE